MINLIELRKQQKFIEAKAILEELKEDVKKICKDFKC